MKVLPTKKIRDAIAQFGGAPDLYWKYLSINLESRTAPSGYALYCRTGIRENGEFTERRLWCYDLVYARAPWQSSLKNQGLPEFAQGWKNCTEISSWRRMRTGETNPGAAGHF